MIQGAQSHHYIGTYLKQFMSFFFSINRSNYESTVNTNGILFADTFIQSGDGETQDITPSLTEAILDPDSFLVSNH